MDVAALVVFGRMKDEDTSDLVFAPPEVRTCLSRLSIDTRSFTSGVGLTTVQKWVRVSKPVTVKSARFKTGNDKRFIRVRGTHSSLFQQARAFYNQVVLLSTIYIF